MALQYTHTLWNAVSVRDMDMDGLLLFLEFLLSPFSLMMILNVRATSSPLSALVFMC